MMPPPRNQQQLEVIGGHSFVGSLAGQTLFNWQAGVTLGQPLPLTWADFEYLATALQGQTGAHGGSVDVHVFCADGTYSMDSLSGQLTGRTGYNTLVVFNTAERVTLRASVDGRQFMASVLAPFAEVLVDSDVGYIDGTLVARSLQMRRNGGAVQLHGACFGHGASALSCSITPRATGGNCPSAGGRLSCTDALGERKCLRRSRKGKCYRRRLQERKCQRTCGRCSYA